jgi:hypothetical protein
MQLPETPMGQLADLTSAFAHGGIWVIGVILFPSAVTQHSVFQSGEVFVDMHKADSFQGMPCRP